MKEGRKGGRKIFTIIIGGIIAGILATIAVPLYMGYVERARVAEAGSIMETIIVSQMVEKRRTGKYYSASTVAEFKSRKVDITDTKFFTYETVATLNGGFIVMATTTEAFGEAGGAMTYTYDPSADPPGSWSAGGVTILPEILPLMT